MESTEIFPKVVYIEAVLMGNGELLHYGASLGFVNDRQLELVRKGASKITKGGEEIVAIGDRTA